MALLENPKYKFLFFLALFFVINLLQSTYTGLLEDEAYYWVWSENLAWGYFDHPPMVAVFIWLGGLLFEGELGVRILSVLSFTLMLWFMWDIIEDKEKNRNVGLFFLLVVSLALIQVYGFISTPDTPLLLFTAIFFWIYKRFLSNKSFLNTFLLGLVMAALLYSKYHAALILFFVMLSNLGLLRSSRFWLAGVFGLILFSPHLLWQYEHGFPSFVYHLKERGHKPYSIGFTLTHILNVLVVVGITFPVIYGAFFKKKANNELERGLMFVVYGFIVFFFLSSFKSQPQAQWLAAILIPLCILTFPIFIRDSVSRKWLLRLGFVQFGIIVLARLLLAIPALSPIVLEPHLAETWVPGLQTKTGGAPVVFVNSYQNASVYTFYTGIDTHSFGIPRGRQSQYSLLNTEAKLQGRAVYGVGKQLTDQPFLVDKGDDKLFGFRIDPYSSFQKLTCRIDTDLLQLQPGKETKVTFTLINPYDQTISFENTRFFGIFQGERKTVLAEVPLDLSDLKPLLPNEERWHEVFFTVPVIKEENVVTFRIGISFHNLPAGLQGNRVLVEYNTNTHSSNKQHK